MSNDYNPAQGAPEGGDGMDPATATAAAAAWKTLTDLYASYKQSGATVDAAQILADAQELTGIRAERMSKEQIRHLSWALERDYDQFKATQEGNWEMERAREMRGFGETGDEAFNIYGLARQEGRMGYEESAADRFNARAELLADTKREYGRYAPQQRRIGRLGALMGAPQPPGGREIPSIELPGALQQPEWVPLPAPRQTPFEYPAYRTPPAWKPYQPAEEEAAPEPTTETERDAFEMGLTVPEYLRHKADNAATGGRRRLAGTANRANR